MHPNYSYYIMKKILLAITFVSLSFLSATAQPNASGYETIKDMPVFYKQLRESLTYPMAWGNSPIKKFDKWKKAAHQVLLDCLSPAPPLTEFAMTVTGKEKRDGYEVRKILFNVSAWSRIPAYLLIPEGEGPFPAVVALHDHGAHFSIGKEKMVRPFGVNKEIAADAQDWAERCYDGTFVGDELARKGYVVLATDALFWGERGRKEGVRYDSQQALAANLLQMGMSWSALITFDDMACARFLASLPEVDKERIGSLGFSMGAYRSWMLAAASEQIKAAASVCWMNTTDSLMTLTNNQNKGGSAYAMLVPGIRNYMDYPHVASIACPKSMLFFNGAKDKLFPVAGVEDAYRILHAVWHSQRADDKLVTKIWDEKHFFNREMQQEVLEFFDKHLKE